MALLSFFKGNKTVRCGSCGAQIKESEAKQLNGKSYCAACYDHLTAKPVSKPQVVEVSATMHPAIQAIKDSFDKADLHCKVNHIGDQWELHAGINGKANTYTVKFIIKDDGKNDVAVRAFSLTSFPENRKQEAYKLLNQIQRKYRYIRLVIDSSCNVNLEYDFPSCTKDIGKASVEMLLRIMKMVDEFYPEIMRAIWS